MLPLYSTGAEKVQDIMVEEHDITRMLQDIDSGKDGALDELMQAVYADLQRVAEKHLRQHFGSKMAGITLEPAALVNESFMRLIRQRKAYDNRGQFFAIATKTMLRVLGDYERRRTALKRGGGRRRVTLSLVDSNSDQDDNSNPGEENLIGVNVLTEALERLEVLDERKADVVKMRVVWGLEMKEIAESLGVSLSTVERDWSFARAWLAREAENMGAETEND